jgi:hypothetical protein
MNGNAFGFPQYPQRPSVSPQAVGQALVSQNMMQQQPVAMPGAGVVSQMAAPSPDQSTPQDNGLTPSGLSNTALQMAVKEALLRAKSGGPSRGQQGEPSVPFATMQLERMGISPLEIKLLQMGGGLR